MEKWKDLLGYEGLYRISNYGNISSVNWKRTGVEKLMRPGKDKNGYLLVCLRKDGKNKWHKMHRLVWETFNGPIPDGYEINHQNEDKADNRLSNLSITSHKENINWGTSKERAGKKHRKTVLQYAIDGGFIHKWSSMSQAAKCLQIDVGQISACCNGKPHYNTAGGFKWRLE